MFALISTVCTNSIGSYYLLYHRFGKKSMYKLHKISQRFLCRIPIYSKQGVPWPPARLCTMVHVYPYPGTPTPIPMVPHTYYLHTYMHWYICLSYCLCLFYCLYLSYSSLPSYSLSSHSLLACVKDCPWAGAAGFISLVYVNILFYLTISQKCVCIVRIHVFLHIRQYMCMYYSLCMYPIDVCVCT